MHCTGCWAAEYGNRLNLSLETIDSIIRQGKELGVYMYIYTGGEPLVRKADLIKICEMHPDCEFLSFTNGTLIDDNFCKEMLRVKNFVPAISLEGFEDANDGRRGDGSYAKVKHAMDLLKNSRLPFGISTCYTSRNYQDISSETGRIEDPVRQGYIFKGWDKELPDVMPEGEYVVNAVWEPGEEPVYRAALDGERGRRRVYASRRDRSQDRSDRQHGYRFPGGYRQGRDDGRLVSGFRVL